MKKPVGICGKRKAKIEEKNKIADFVKRFKRYEKIIKENISGDKSEVEIVNYLIKVIVEHLNYNLAVYALETESVARRNYRIDDIYLEMECKLLKKDNPFNTNERAEIGINDLPILLSPWNGGRIINNLFGINDDNVFDGANKNYAANVNNSYLYPMNIIVCNGANHSQFSARFKNKGTTYVRNINNYSELYNKVYFDGNCYRQQGTNEEVSFSVKYDETLFFYSGVIFELARYLLKNEYYDVNFPKEKICKFDE